MYNYFGYKLYVIKIWKGGFVIARENHASNGGPRVNREIFIDPVRLIDNNGKMLGVVKLNKALEIAESVGLDLVEVSPHAKPPVCKILDHGKFKFEAQKKAAKARKKQKVIDIKEVKFRPNIDTNDFNIKMKNVVRFLSSGDKVKITLRYRGREMAHRDLGIKILNKIREETKTNAKVELEPKLEGRQATMILAPEDKISKDKILVNKTWFD